MTASAHLPGDSTSAEDSPPTAARTLNAPTHPRSWEAWEARDALATALTRAGVQLPAMDVRTPWADEDRHALVHLGVCSTPVAHALAAVIAKGADR